MSDENVSDQSVSDDKQRLRAELRASLRGISAERAERAGLEIADHLARWPRWLASGEVALFASLPGEVDSGPILEVARRRGMQILLPRMRAGSSLEFVAVEDFEDLSRGRYGVREPEARRPARTLGIEAIVLMPGLAFDRRGGRLGRGAGYYDRALARIAPEAVRPCLVGVGFDLQVVDRVPMSTHDVYMDAIVTERGFIAASGSRGKRPVGTDET